MARAQHPDSAGSQFFICLADARFLDRQYTAFGELIKGDDILGQIDAGKRAHSGGLRWAQDAVSGMLMVREPTHVRLTIAATDNAFLDYWESRFELTECTPL